MEWFEDHNNKHKEIINKLLNQEYSKEEIIEYFRYDNMVIEEPNFCLLYKTNTKCHQMKDLNCFMCGCKFFRFNDDGLHTKDNIQVKSLCSINSTKSKSFIYDNIAHLDCSNCIVPHTKGHISKNFDYNWSKIMKDTKI